MNTPTSNTALLDRPTTHPDEFGIGADAGRYDETVLTRAGLRALLGGIPMSSHRIYECGICSCYHPWSWDGDCREDGNRYGSPEEYAEATKLSPDDIEVFSWEDRCEEDEECSL